jgi:hypothetical protein
MDILVEAITSRISDTTMIGKTITALAITIRSAATVVLPMRAALAAGMKEALAVAMAVAAMAAAVIAKQRSRRDHA